MKIKPVFLPVKKYFLPILAAVLCVLIAAGEWLYYRHEANAIRAQKQEEIKSIAVLKSGQIIQWRRERIADANVTSGSEFFIDRIKSYLESRNNFRLKNEIIQRLVLAKTSYSYKDIFLFTPAGELLISTDPGRFALEPLLIAKISEAAGTKRAEFTDFYYCPDHNDIHYDIIIPVINNPDKLLAMLVFRIDPAGYLFPLIRSWPVPSKTSETLLGRKDGDSALYLNEPRYRKNTALRLRIPLAETGVPAVQAVLGYKGFYEGTDYNGRRVVSYIEPIPDTPWFMVANVDKSEIYSELYYRMAYIIVFSVTLIALAGSGFIFIYNTRQKNILRQLLVKETELRKSQEEHRTVLYSIGDAVITTDTSGIINRMNHVAEKLTGWVESESIGMPLEKIFRIINEETKQAVENPAARVLKEGMITGVANHTLLVSRNGKEIPVEDSGAPIKNENGEVIGVVLVFRDQSEERESRKAILENEKNYRNLFEHSAAGLSVIGVNDSLRVNKSFNDILGYPENELNAKKCIDITHPDDIGYTLDILQSLQDGKIPKARFEIGIRIAYKY